MEKIQYRTLLKESQDKLFENSGPETVEQQEMRELVKPEVKIGYWWGPWNLGGRNALFCYDPNSKAENPVCWINLENMTSSAEILNTIFKTVNNKWATPEVLGNLLWALEDIFNPRKNICPGGVEVPFNYQAQLTRLGEIDSE